MMTAPLVILGVLTVGIGLVNTPFRLSFENFLEPAFEGVAQSHAPENTFLLVALAAISVLAGVVGIAIAYLLYSRAGEVTRLRILAQVRRPPERVGERLLGGQRLQHRRGPAGQTSGHVVGRVRGSAGR